MYERTIDTVVRVVSVASKVTWLRWMTPPLSPSFISAPLFPAVVWFLVRRRRLLLVCLDLWPQFEHNGAHTCPVLERSPSLMVHFVGVYFTPNDAGGSPPLGAASLGRVATAETVCGLRCFAAVGRKLLRTMISTPSVSLILREKALTWCMKCLAPTWVVRATTRAQRDPCAPTLCD